MLLQRLSKATNIPETTDIHTAQALPLVVRSGKKENLSKN